MGNMNAKKVSDKWTNLLLNIIEKESTNLNFGLLTQIDVNTIPWNLLLKCTSVTHLQINGFPSPITPNKSRKSENKPTYTRQDIERLFPSQIFEMTNLKILEMNNYPFEYISSNIGKLINLTKLSMIASRIICLPIEIGQLKKLECLEHYCSYSISFSPYEIRNCSLKTTYISRRPNYIYNNQILPPLPKPIDMKCIINDLKIIFVKYGLIEGVVDIIINYLPYQQCSNRKCKNKIHFKKCIYYAWSYYRPGADIVCLLAQMCSNKCIQSIQKREKIFYLAKMENEKYDKKMYVNVNVNDKGNNVVNKPFRHGGVKYLDDLKSELDRFEYFWKYKLGIKYKSYQLTEENQKEIMVTFNT
eukprot:46395_1